MGAPSSRSFADLLRDYRTQVGLTQEELAARANLSVDAISLLERGARQRPRKDTLALLATALALSPGDHAVLVAAAQRSTRRAGSRGPNRSEREPQAVATPDAALAVPTIPPHAPPERFAGADPRSHDAITVAPKRMRRAEEARTLLVRRSALFLYQYLPYLLLVALVFSVDSLGAALGGRQSGPTLPPAAADRQQVLQVGVLPLHTLDPQLVSYTNDYETTQLIFPGLVQFDEQLRVEPWAASRYAISPDGRTYTFTVRPGVTWSDGVPITADDFAFAINRALDPCTQAPAASYLFPITDAAAYHAEVCTNGVPSGALDTLVGRSVQVIGKQMLVLHLHDPAAYFLEALTYPISWAVPQTLISRYGMHWTEHLADGGGLGGDLFKVVGWQMGGRLVLQRNPRFWGSRAKLREIDFTPTSDAKTMYAAYLAGTGDVSFVDPEQSASAKLRADFQSVATLQMAQVGLNWSQPPFNDQRMRQAFALALNKVQLDRDSFGDAVFPSNHLVPQGMPGYYTGLSGPDNTQNLTGNLARASALAQAYADDQCWGDLRRCPPVRFGVIDQFPNAETFASEAQAMWLQAMPGYPITFSVVTFGEWMQEVSTDKLELWTFSWGADYPDPQDWLSNLLLEDSPWNFGHVNLAEANTLMRQADSDQNPVRRQSEYNQAEQFLVTASAVIPLFQMRLIFVTRPDVINYQVTALGQPSSNIWQQVYIARH